MTEICAVCRGPIPASRGAGRPRIYCSTECRREIERQRRSWDSVEANKEVWRQMAAFGHAIPDHPEKRP